jgi:competence protein ComFC
MLADAVLPRLQRGWEAALDILFPRRCVGCGHEGAFICPACLDAMPRLASDPGFSTAPEDPSALDSLTAAFAFEGVVRQAAHQLKYRHLKGLAPLLATRLHAETRDRLPQADLIIPIPLHPSRQRERGFNQSALLTRHLSALTLIPTSETMLRRTRHHPSQARAANLLARRVNVRGAFQANGIPTGCRVILVDDVATSGATLNTAAAALKADGAGEVHGLALSREV